MLGLFGVILEFPVALHMCSLFADEDLVYILGMPVHSVLFISMLSFYFGLTFSVYISLFETYSWLVSGSVEDSC